MGGSCGAGRAAAPVSLAAATGDPAAVYGGSFVIDLTPDEIDAISEALHYAKRAVLDDRHSPKEVKEAKTARLESASRKVAQLRQSMSGTAG